MLLTLASLATQAQDVYEYATVSYNFKIYISYSDGKYLEESVDKAVLSTSSTVPVLKRVEEMNKEGWEVISSEHNGNTWHILLKRKVK